jgi:hypothetical protein
MYVDVDQVLEQLVVLMVACSAVQVHVTSCATPAEGTACAARSEAWFSATW